MGSINRTTSSPAAAQFSLNQSEVNDEIQANGGVANALGILFLYSVAMFTLPIGAYFCVYHVLWYDFGVRDFSNTFWSVLAAVVVVNVIIASYALRALKEEEKSNVSKFLKIN